MSCECPIMRFNRQARIQRGRNRLERSGFRTILQRRSVCLHNRTVSERGIGEHAFHKSVSLCRLLEALLEDTPESVDAGLDSLWLKQHLESDPVEDRGTGRLPRPAVHQSDAVGLPVPERSGSPVTGLRT